MKMGEPAAKDEKPTNRRQQNLVIQLFRQRTAAGKKRECRPLCRGYSALQGDPPSKPCDINPAIQYLEARRKS
jgi:hypothetical protein